MDGGGWREGGFLFVYSIDPEKNERWRRGRGGRWKERKKGTVEEGGEQEEGVHRVALPHLCWPHPIN